MLSITLKESLFDAVAGRAPWNKMTQAESVKTNFILEATEAEINAIPIIPGTRTAQSVSGQPGCPVGSNAVRTIPIRRYQPTQVDERYWRPQTVISGNVGIVGKISEGIDAGILSVRKDASTTDMTAVEFFNYMLGQ